MDRAPKRLTLTRETLTTLNDVELSDIAGAALSDVCVLTKVCITVDRCITDYCTRTLICS